jgi:hypothetical protein
LAVGTFGTVIHSKVEKDIQLASKGAKSARKNIVNTQERIKSGDLSTHTYKDDKGRVVREERPSLLATGVVKAKKWAEKRRIEKVSKKPTLPAEPVMRDTEDPISRQAIRRDDEPQKK